MSRDGGSLGLTEDEACYSAWNIVTDRDILRCLRYIQDVLLRHENDHKVNGVDLVDRLYKCYIFNTAHNPLQ